MMKIYSFRNPPPQVDTDPGDEPSLTQQHFVQECDINNVVAKYVKTGVLPDRGGAFYGDFDNSLDYRSMLDIMRNASDDFMQLPASTRDFFGNDPSRLIDFLHDKNNADQAIQLGLVDPRHSSPLDVTVTTDTNPQGKDIKEP